MYLHRLQRPLCKLCVGADCVPKWLKDVGDHISIKTVGDSVISFVVRGRIYDRLHSDVLRQKCSLHRDIPLGNESLHRMNLFG